MNAEEQDTKIIGVDQPESEAQEGEVSDLPFFLQEDYREHQGKLLELSKEQESRIKNWLKKRIDEWKTDTTELHQMLEEDNDLVEGYVDEPADIYQGWGSNIHIDVTGIYMEVYQAIEKRSILGADLIWYGETDDENLWGVVADIDEMLNYKARNEWNIAKAIPMAIWAKNRDSLCAVQVTWEEDWETGKDIIVLTSILDFIEEFPDPESGGMTPEQWNQLRTYVESNATEDDPVEIPIKVERRTYYGNKAHIVEYADFVTFPATVATIYGPSCRGYGKRYRERKEEIQSKIESETYYEKAGKELIKKKSDESSINSYQKSKDYISGLKRTNNADEYGLYELVIKGRLDGKESEEGKYLVTYDHQNDILLRAVEYFYRVDFYAIFVLNERPNQLGGVSIPRKTRNSNDEIDTGHNQRINARAISSIPTFVADPIIKEGPDGWDPQAPENRWRPGLIVWTKYLDKFVQNKIQPTDLGESMQEEANSFRILDLSLGSPASLFSGQSPTSDPNAPGNKTAMLINQGNMRMEDVLDEDRHGISMLGKICLSHVYQFGPPVLSWMSQSMQNGAPMRQTKTLHRKFLRKNINMNMKGISVILNPDAEMQKRMLRHQFLMQEPLFQQDANRRIESMRDVLRAGRDKMVDKLLPPAEEIQKQQVEIQKQAMMQMQMQKMMQAKQQQEAAMVGRIKGAQRQLQVRSLAERMAKMNLNGSTNGTALETVPSSS